MFSYPSIKIQSINIRDDYSEYDNVLINDIILFWIAVIYWTYKWTHMLLITWVLDSLSHCRHFYSVQYFSFLFNIFSLKLISLLITILFLIVFRNFQWKGWGWVPFHQKYGNQGRSLNLIFPETLSRSCQLNFLLAFPFRLNLIFWSYFL